MARALLLPRVECSAGVHPNRQRILQSQRRALQHCIEGEITDVAAGTVVPVCQAANCNYLSNILARVGGSFRVNSARVDLVCSFNDFQDLLSICL